MGIGQAEPKTERLNKRANLILAFTLLYILPLCLVLVAMFKEELFSEFLAFSGPIMGGVVAFYFSKGKSR